MNIEYPRENDGHNEENYFCIARKNYASWWPLRYPAVIKSNNDNHMGVSANRVPQIPMVYHNIFLLWKILQVCPILRHTHIKYAEQNWWSGDSESCFSH